MSLNFNIFIFLNSEWEFSYLDALSIILTAFF